jgi:hypothetical protein
MNIDWDLVLKIAIPLATLVLGKFLDQLFAKKTRLVSYLGHVSAFTLQNQTQVYTHSIVVRNVGRQTANNVRIGHHVLPADHRIHPPVPYTIQQTPGGGAEIQIPTLVPGEQVTISYLYFPPVTFTQINAYTKSDEGAARILTVFPRPQPPKWYVRSVWTLVFIGATSVLYVLALLIRWLLA